MYHDYTQYSKIRHTAIFTQVPIAYLYEFRAMAASLGQSFKIRYRGPRTKNIDSRSREQRKGTCLKQNATSFSVYRY